MSVCLPEIYDAALDPGYWPEALAAISNRVGYGCGVTLVHSSLSCFAEGDIWMHQVDVESYRRSPPDLLTPEGNPGIRAALRAPLGQLVDRRSFLLEEEMGTHPVSRQFFLPNGIQHMLIGAVQMDFEVGSLFCLSREWGSEAFDAGEAVLAQDIAFHIGRAMRLHRRVHLMEVHQTAYSIALDRLSAAVLLCDIDLRVHQMNAAAQELISGARGVTLFMNRLLLVDPLGQQRLELAAKRLGSSVPEVGEIRIVARRAETARPLVLTLYPAIGTVPASVAPRGRVLIFLDDHEERSAMSRDRLMTTFELTATEARVAIRAAEARSLPQIATEFSVSINTIKSHMKAVYEKTGARSRADLVNILRAAY